MEKITDILERAQLRGFGAFLMDGGGELWDCPEDGFSAEELLKNRRDNLNITRLRGEDETKDLRALEEANRRIGFYSGLRAGARMMLELLGEGEMKF